MTKPVLAYIGHSYHQKTASNAFFLDLLQQRYAVSTVLDTSWQATGQPVSAEKINSLRAEIVVFYQTLPARKLLRQIACKRIFYVPMHDYVLGHPGYPWHKLRSSGIRVISFCNAMHRFFTHLGNESIFMQYWPSPIAPPPEGHGLNIFFWPRRHEIGWQVLKALLGKTRPERIVLRTAFDPDETADMPSAVDICDYRITIVDGWLNKEQYLDLLKSCNVFMAPRPLEGIGLSFLEAMAHGLAVIAPNQPTMNEYIQHNHNGYLYDLSTPSPLSFSNIGNIRQQALLDVTAGYHAWQARQHEILDFMASPARRKASLMWRIRRWLAR